MVLQLMAHPLAIEVRVSGVILAPVVHKGPVCTFPTVAAKRLSIAIRFISMYSAAVLLLAP